MNEIPGLHIGKAECYAVKVTLCPISKSSLQNYGPYIAKDRKLDKVQASRCKTARKK